MTVVMAKLTVMPHEAIIDGLKGSIDFYFNMGIPCARSWPRSPGKRRAHSVMAQWPAFSFATREWKNLSQAVQDSYTQFSTDSGLAGRDLQIRAYLTGLYRYPLE